jgi:cytochrome c5
MFPKLIRQVVRQSHNESKTTRKFGGKLVVILATVLVAGAATALPPGTEDEIRTRLLAVGQLCRAGDDCGGGAAASASAGPRSGEEVYNQFCFACHATGVGGAPMVGDAAAWEPRIAKGMDALWGTMQNGLNAMPPMGTCMTCSEDELRASMNYLVDSAK